MREHSRDQGRLEDILKYAQNVEKIMDGISYEDFTKDIRIYYSVMKNVEVIGEAANMLTRHFREAAGRRPLYRNRQCRLQASGRISPSHESQGLCH